MAMDFFESQETARKKTGVLVVLFGLAVIAIMVLVYIVVGIFFAGYQIKIRESGGLEFGSLLDPRIMLGVGFGTILVVGGASLYKLSELRAGGRVIAESLDGRLLSRGTTDATERKLLNVVEEMAIASGTPVPPVYLLDRETGINAFAAGYSPGDAVIGVTRGCAELLSRDELQGVIAHEFSHILNGDMRLNIRLIGLLHGILVIGLIGSMIFRVAIYSPRTSRRSKEGGGQLALLGLGAALAIIGFIGTFFGKVIKAAVSRQREFLADASAVQFTRLPDGIAGALQKIGGLSRGARLHSPRANEASHMYFGQGVAVSFSALFATHPDLGERIRRIQPSWDGRFPRVAEPRPVEAARQPAMAAAAAAGGVPQAGMLAALAAARTEQLTELRSAVSRIGRPTEQHLAYAQWLVEQIPEPVRQAAREAYGARAIIYALLLNHETGPRRRQLERLQAHADVGVYDETRRLEPMVGRLDARLRLPLLDLTLSSLRELTVQQYRAFRGNVDELMKADEEIDVFEWVIRRIIDRHLSPHFEKVRPPVVQYYNLNGLIETCSVLLSTLAFAGHRDASAAGQAFTLGAARLQLGGLALIPRRELNLVGLDDALDRLTQVTPRYKRLVLEACADCIAADRKVTVREGELLRAVSDALDCPMPPLLPGQPVGQASQRGGASR